jgi:sigma-B regulation protein RsbU (phosphoserine phosphatase)
MQNLLLYSLLMVAVAVLALSLKGVKLRLKSKDAELQALEGEEERMFAFLHDLGSAIGSDTTTNGLYRLIVDGVNRVVAAKGGCLYLLDDSRQWLQPKYLSEGCPALVPLPADVREKAARDPRSLESHLRLAKVPAEGGILGRIITIGDAASLAALQHHSAFGPNFLETTAGISAMFAPLRHAGKDIGILAVTRAEATFSANDFAVFRTVAEQSAFAIGNAQVHREASEKRQIEGELRNAREVQRVLLPQGDPDIPGYRVSGMNMPARIISGDYYDYLNLDAGRHGIVIADVSGKGVAAGLLMAMCRSVLRSLSREHRNPADTLAGVNRQLFPDIREDMFITLFYAVIEGDEGKIRVARAGHDAALIYRAEDRTVIQLKPPGLALGIDEGDVFERVTKVEEVHLNPGDCLLFYTDGVKEAIDASGDEYGMERLRKAFLAGASQGAQASVRAVEKDLAEFTGDSPQMDDITLVAIEKR